MALQPLSVTEGQIAFGEEFDGMVDCSILLKVPRADFPNLDDGDDATTADLLFDMIELPVDDPRNIETLAVEIPDELAGVCLYLAGRHVCVHVRNMTLTRKAADRFAVAAELHFDFDYEGVGPDETRALQAELKVVDEIEE